MAVPASVSQAGPKGQSGLDHMPLTIRAATGAHAFDVEIARTGEQQAIGLMYRRSLAPDSGMLFLFDPPQPVSFWMKNTFIPLDILFIDADHRIANIAANAPPQSLDLIPSEGPIVAVLEISGGRAAELGLKPGDAVDW